MTRYLNILKSICAALLLLTALGCAAATPPQETATVQDINPGEKSMISAPATPSAQSPVQEKNI